MARMYMSKRMLNGLAAEMVTESSEFQALGPKIAAAIRAEAAKHRKTGAYASHIKMTRTKNRIWFGKDTPAGRNADVEDWWVYNDDPDVFHIEWGSLRKDKDGKVRAEVKPLLIVTKANDRIK